MRRFFTEYLRADRQKVTSYILEFLYDDSGAVRNLLIKEPQELLPDNFLGNSSFRHIGDHIRRKIPVTLTYKRIKLLEYYVYSVVFLCGDRYYRRKFKFLGKCVHCCEYGAFFEFINLIDQ
ncbi:hypothetical protein SDC9_77816 [bioreactor metagenome]|uniref:Uncharacterized protein n=1 Tax=bioreactor metagenome TaxID=1076179 RepID=A0A644YTR9_9ZZZZ